MNLRRTLATLTLAAATAFGGWTVGHSTAAPAPIDAVQVDAFNDGWSTGMQDACDQGSAYACNWLSTTR
ncbi:hypothetical protein [Kitasatospora purpeofusca]|uniref:hypothetical protein n=1 Tax=Kitasatospora purpeofusca TaxID=67352 RepID=UPI0032438845|nr:hypothetical protein OIP63_05805 [Kitasatospora purpeofusca]